VFFVGDNVDATKPIKSIYCAAHVGLLQMRDTHQFTLTAKMPKSKKQEKKENETRQSISVMGFQH